MLKKVIYILSFTVLGIMVQFLLHTALEVWYVKLLLLDFERYGLGLSWDAWFIVHHAGALLLLFAGTILGAWQGAYWWRILYIEKRTRFRER